MDGLDGRICIRPLFSTTKAQWTNVSWYLGKQINESIKWIYPVSWMLYSMLKKLFAVVPCKLWESLDWQCWFHAFSATFSRLIWKNLKQRKVYAVPITSKEQFIQRITHFDDILRADPQLLERVSIEVIRLCQSAKKDVAISYFFDFNYDWISQKFQSLNLQQKSDHSATKSYLLQNFITRKLKLLNKYLKKRVFQDGDIFLQNPLDISLFPYFIFLLQ